MNAMDMAQGDPRLEAAIVRSRKLLHKKAMTGAVTSMVPIPGVDWLVDASLMTKVIPQINQEFGLTQAQIARLDPQKQERIQKAIAAVAHALAPEAAHAEHRADAGEAGVAPAQQPVCRTDQQHGAQCFEDAHAHLQQRREMKNACCCLLPFRGARAVAQRRKTVFLFEQP